MKPSPLTTLPMIAILFWVATLIFAPGDYNSISIVLIGTGLLILATIGTVGFVLVGGVWSRNLLTAVVAATFVLAVLRPLDNFSWVGLGLSAGAALAIHAPRQQGMIRKLPSAQGPPPNAVVVTIVGLAAPLVLGLVPVEANMWVAVFSATSVFASAMYAKTVTGGLVLIRYVVPILAIALASPMGIAHGVVAIAIAAVVGVVAQSNDVLVAFHPVAARGTAYPIPPELAPGEILDGAGLDQRGRPKKDGTRN